MADSVPAEAAAGLVRVRGRGGQSAPSHRGCTEAVTECARRRRVEDWHGAVASDTARGSGRCASGVIMSHGFPVSPLRDWIWFSRSCTCRGLMMYLSCTAGGRCDRGCCVVRACERSSSGAGRSCDADRNKHEAKRSPERRPAAVAAAITTNSITARRSPACGRSAHACGALAWPGRPSSPGRAPAATRQSGE